MITKEMSLGEIVNKYPTTINIFKSQNIDGFSDPNKIVILNKLSLEMMSKTKKLDINNLLNILNTSITNISIDISTEKREYEKDAVNLLGLLPCPIKIPLLEAFKNFDIENPKVKLNYELQSASLGSEWLRDSIEYEDLDKIPDIYLSTGFELFFSKNIKEKLNKNKLFIDKNPLKNYNKVFDNVLLKDPYQNYSLLGVVPAVMLVNTNELKGRKFPNTWEDMLAPEFENSISIPMGDLDLYNAIVVTIHSKFGDEGIKKLKRNYLNNMHPSQMIKADRLKSEKPVITIIPYFFSQMLPKNSNLVVNWPKDGAIISPIFLFIKNTPNMDLEKITKFLFSKNFGSILTKQGYFPSIHPEVDNNLGDKKFIWAGWEYIYNNDIDNIIKECTKILS